MGWRDLCGLLERERRELCPAARHFPKRAARSTWLLAYSPDGPRVNWFELLFAMAEPLLQLVPLNLAGGAAREFINTNEANPKGVVVSDEELAGVNIVRADFHGEWNCTIKNRSDGAANA